MVHERKPIWHTAREYATHWLVAGVILAATGFAPEEWLAQLPRDVHVSAAALHLWTTGIDLRLAVVVVGCAFIAGDITWRNLGRRAAGVGSVAPATIASAAVGPVAPAPVSALPPQSAAPLPLPDRPSIAVLPFANMGGDPEQDYFSDGVADDIITELSRNRSLFVIARNSSFTYRGRSVDVKQVARELGVRYVLEGSVRRDGDQLRVNAQLIDAANGNHLWAERYDRPVQHVFAVQDEITVAVAIAIVPAIGDAERRRMLRKPPERLDTWETYQRGLWHLAKSTPVDNDQAQVLFQRAAEIDQGFAPAYVGLALAHIDAAVSHGMRPMQAAAKLAEPAARTAVAIDPDDADAQSTLGFVFAVAGDHASGLACAERALAINRNAAFAQNVMGGILVFSGHWAEGRGFLRTSLRLNPRDARRHNVFSTIAFSYYSERDYEGAVEAARRALVECPEYAPVRRFLAAALGQLGRREEAATALREAIAAAPRTFEAYARNRPPWYRPEDQEHLLDGLRKAGWQG